MCGCVKYICNDSCWYIFDFVFVIHDQFLLYGLHFLLHYSISCIFTGLTRPNYMLCRLHVEFLLRTYIHT
jgi:hypothetical protein